ncbi:MAG: LptF/LptG family permease [Gemmatimonadota bacterium]|nr:LptF/LptG family permease [Gemmatimonadota bacterium]
MIFARLLDRYLMAQFLRVLTVALFALAAITIMVHLMDHIDVYLDHEAAWRDVAEYYLLEAPYNLLITLPMAVLIATILTIGEFGRHGELTAMKASGLSLYRISAPIAAFAFLLSLGVLVVSETWLPGLIEQANDVYDEQILGRGGEDIQNYRGRFVYQNEEGYTYIVRSLFVEDGASNADQVEIQRHYPDGTFVRINAPQMVWEPATETWVLRNGEMRVFPDSRPAPAEPFPAETAPNSRATADTAPADTAPAEAKEEMYAFEILRSPFLEDTPQQLLVQEKDPEEMGYLELEEYIERRERLGAETRKERVDLQMKLAYPFANFIVAIFGIALVGAATHAGRQSGAAAGFGFALFLTIVFWGFLRIGQGVGYGGGLPPAAAAWLANGVFLVIGLVLLTRART